MARLTPKVSKGKTRMIDEEEEEEMPEEEDDGRDGSGVNDEEEEAQDYMAEQEKEGRKRGVQQDEVSCVAAYTWRSTLTRVAVAVCRNRTWKWKRPRCAQLCGRGRSVASEAVTNIVLTSPFLQRLGAPTSALQWP